MESFPFSIGNRFIHDRLADSDSQDDSSILRRARWKGRGVALTHRSIVRCRYNLGLESLRKCRKWNYCARPSAHLVPLPTLPSWCSSGGATPARPFPAIFGNFHPFTRANNTRAVCGARRAVIWKGNRVLPRKNLAASDGGKNLDYVSSRQRTNGRNRGNTVSKIVWNDVLARVLKIGFVQFSNLALLDFIIRLHVYPRIWSRQIVATRNFICPSCNFVVSLIRSRYYYVNFLIFVNPACLTKSNFENTFMIIYVRSALVEFPAMIHDRRCLHVNLYRVYFNLVNVGFLSLIIWPPPFVQIALFRS